MKVSWGLWISLALLTFLGSTTEGSPTEKAPYSDSVSVRSQRVRRCANPPCEVIDLVVPLKQPENRNCAQPPCEVIDLIVPLRRKENPEKKKCTQPPCEVIDLVVPFRPGKWPEHTDVSIVDVATKDSCSESFQADPTAMLSYLRIMPTMTNWTVLENALFYHADPNGGPYSADDFAAAFTSKGLNLDNVKAYGIFELPHFWYFAFTSPEAKAEFKNAGNLCIHKKLCLVIDPEVPAENCSALQLRLEWLPHHIKADQIFSALASFGDVSSVGHDEASPFTKALSTVRLVKINLKTGVNPEDLPVFMKIAGFNGCLTIMGPHDCIRRKPNCYDRDPFQPVSPVTYNGGVNEPYPFILDERSEAAQGKTASQLRATTPES